MIKIFIIILLMLSASFVRADDVNISCQSGECGDLARGIGWAVLGAGVLFGPHLLLKNEAFDANVGGSKFSAGVGEENLKEVSFDLNTSFPSHQKWQVATNGNMQLYDKNTPTIMRYGIGTAYKLQANQFIFIPTLKASLEKIESVTSVRVGPELGANIVYSFTDEFALLSEVRGIWYKEFFWKGSFGAFFGFRNSFFSKTFVMMSYQQNDILDKKIYSVDFGFYF